MRLQHQNSVSVLKNFFSHGSDNTCTGLFRALTHPTQVDTPYSGNVSCAPAILRRDKTFGLRQQQQQLPIVHHKKLRRVRTHLDDRWLCSQLTAAIAATATPAAAATDRGTSDLRETCFAGSSLRESSSQGSFSSETTFAESSSTPATTGGQQVAGASASQRLARRK